jgi:small subunit ribosomal protein S13
MARIVGVDIPDNKALLYSLTYVKGIGLAKSAEVIERLGLDPKKKAKELTEEEVSKISSMLDKEYVVEGELIRQVKDNVKRLIDIKTYRGRRHIVGLPARGQSTRYNARTRKGPRKVVSGVSVRKAVSKT